MFPVLDSYSCLESTLASARMQRFAPTNNLEVTWMQGVALEKYYYRPSLATAKGIPYLYYLNIFPERQ